MKKIIFLIFSVMLFASNLQTTKTVCEMADNKSISQIKKELLKKLKLAGVEELYGDNIFSQTTVENGNLISDSIKSLATGRIRIKGDPKYFNGKNLGEVCVSATLYITKEDIKDFTPKQIKLNNYCYSNPNVALKDIKEKAKESAYLEIISQYSPSLAKKISPSQAADYIHEFKVNNAKFDFNTGAYCFDAIATIIPYELKFQKFITKQNKISTTVKLASKTKPANLPAYFTNHIWKGSLIYDNRTIDVIAFFLNKEKSYMNIIFLDKNYKYSKKGKRYLYIYKTEGNGIKVFGKYIFYQTIYYSYESTFSKISGVFIGDIFKGVIGSYNVTMKKSKETIYDYFDEIWAGNIDSTRFKNGKIYLMKSKNTINFWADIHPTQNERGSETFTKISQNGVITFKYISPYKSIKGNSYDDFSLTGAMVDDKTFIGAGTKDFITKVELKKVK